MFLEVLHTNSSLGEVREFIPKAWCIGTECGAPNLFRIVSVICNKFLVFHFRVLVIACLTNSSLKYGAALLCMHLKVVPYG